MRRGGDADLVGSPVSGFRWLARGSWTAAQVKITAPGVRHILPACLQPAVAAAWATALARPGVHLFDGQLARLDHWSVESDTLHLALGVTSYHDFVGSNAAHPEWAAAYGRTALADPLGTSAALVSSDGQLVFGVRSPRVALYPGMAHPFGGTCEAGQPDVVGELRRELAEEIHLDTADITDLRVVALVEDLTLSQPELIALVHCRWDLAALTRRLDLDEHGALWSVPATPAAVRAALNGSQRLTPVTRAVLRCWLDHAESTS